jgi:hypothetical protein
MGPVYSGLTKENTNGVRGSVVTLEIVDPGSGYTDNESVSTYIENKFDTYPIKRTRNQESLGPDKIDVLHVDITTDTNGSILTAVPTNTKRGFFYNIGDTVSVFKNSNKNSNIGVLKITQIWPP